MDNINIDERKGENEMENGNENGVNNEGRNIKKKKGWKKEKINVKNNKKEVDK
jgi:hypothetical protein